MCGKDIKSTNHFLLQCFLFFKERQVFLNRIRDNVISLSYWPKSKLCLLHFFLAKMTLKTSIFYSNVHMQQQDTSYQLKGSTFLYLNKPKPLQFITTTIINDSTLFELNIPFLFLLFIILFLRYAKQFYIQRLFLCLPFFIDFISILKSMCICMNRKNISCKYLCSEAATGGVLIKSCS